MWQPERIKGTDFDVRLKALKPDVAVVTAYGRILPKAVLEATSRYRPPIFLIDSFP